MVLDVRGDLQGIDIAGLRASLNQGHDILFEGNPFVPKAIWQLTDFRAPILSIFLSPLSKQEIEGLKSQRVNLAEMLTDIMRRKLLRRTKGQKGLLSLADLENIEKRAKSAAAELRLAWRFDWVIPNHDGEDSENWNAFYYPIGDARTALITFAAILEGKMPPTGAEKWEEELWPEE
jgi:guanylate kinase